MGQALSPYSEAWTCLPSIVRHSRKISLLPFRGGAVIFIIRVSFCGERYPDLPCVHICGIELSTEFVQRTLASNPIPVGLADDHMISQYLVVFSYLAYIIYNITFYYCQHESLWYICYIYVTSLIENIKHFIIINKKGVSHDFARG